MEVVIETLYRVGDKIADKNGQEREIKGVHVWISSRNQTERYYFGNGVWRTIKRNVRKEDEGK